MSTDHSDFRYGKANGEAWNLPNDGFICTAATQFDIDEDLPVPLDELVRRLEAEEKGRALGVTKLNVPQWVPAGPTSHSNIWPAANPFSPQEARVDVTPTLEERASSSNNPVQHAVNYSPYPLHQLEDITNQPGATYFSGDAYQMAADMLYSGPPLGGEDHIYNAGLSADFLSTWSVSPPHTALPTPPAEQAFLESGNNWHSQSQSGSHQAGGLNCGVSQGNDMREQEAFNPNFQSNPSTHTDDQAQGRSYQEYNMIDLPATGNQSSDIPLQETQSYGQLNLGFNDYENYELRNQFPASTQPQWQATSNDIPPVSYNGVPSWNLDPCNSPSLNATKRDVSWNFYDTCPTPPPQSWHELATAIYQYSTDNILYQSHLTRKLGSVIPTGSPVLPRQSEITQPIRPLPLQQRPHQVYTRVRMPLNENLYQDVSDGSALCSSPGCRKRLDLSRIENVKSHWIQHCQDRPCKPPFRSQYSLVGLQILADACDFTAPHVSGEGIKPCGSTFQRKNDLRNHVNRLHFDGQKMCGPGHIRYQTQGEMDQENAARKAAQLNDGRWSAVPNTQ
ncbi:hypothetical protein PSHT_08478 [Puccinia striiformis]|uniref:Uncharacterized protein n=1 Tax=Puccinia striiformis TaxID=27350 RepID=A0A2S4VNT6_9BASI|nr:hypothetical protein PSHT_08478 [Puccinia striiformis]